MTIPRALSPGEELLALHLRANGIEFEREALLVPGRKFRVDFFIAPTLVIEVDGGAWSNGRHTRGPGFAKDCEKLNLLALHGYFVLRYTTEMVQRGDALRDIERMLGGA